MVIDNKIKDDKIRTEYDEVYTPEQHEGKQDWRLGKEAKIAVLAFIAPYILAASYVSINALVNHQKSSNPAIVDVKTDYNTRAGYNTNK